jgi:hypothetical protein
MLTYFDIYSISSYDFDAIILLEVAIIFIATKTPNKIDS